MMEENVFPFNQHGPDHLKEKQDASILAVINGIQNNLGLLLRKVQMLEDKINQLEK